MNPTAIVGLIVGLFAALSAVGVVIVYLKGTVADGTIASLERSNSAYETELKAQKVTSDGKLAEKDTRIADQEKRLTAFEVKGLEQDRTIEILTNVVTNAEEVTAIHDLLEEHHKETLKKLDILDEIKTAVTAA